MAARFCGNCGHELSPNDSFCPNCGRSVRETAHVPTPEADVSVPPPPQQAGSTPNFAPAGAAPQAEGRRRNPLVVGCLAIVGILVLLSLLGTCGALLGAGGGGGGNAGEEPRQEQGSQQQAQGQRDEQAESEPQPEPEPEPEPEPQPKRIILSGSGPEATRPFQLEPGLTVIFMQHQGNGNFIVDLLDENGNSVAPMGVANVIGPFEGSIPVQITQGGQHLLDVQNAGQWQIGILQPRVEDAPEKRNFSGNSPAATPLFELSGGLHRVTLTHQGDANFIVDLLDENGASVVPMGLVNEIGPFEGSRAIQVPEDGIYLFSVEANGPWTINVE